MVANNCRQIQCCSLATHALPCSPPLLLCAVCTQQHFFRISVGDDNIVSTAWAGQRLETLWCRTVSSKILLLSWGRVWVAVSSGWAHREHVSERCDHCMLVSFSSARHHCAVGSATNQWLDSLTWLPMPDYVNTPSLWWITCFDTCWLCKICHSSMFCFGFFVLILWPEVFFFINWIQMSGKRHAIC